MTKTYPEPLSKEYIKSEFGFHALKDHEEDAKVNHLSHHMLGYLELGNISNDIKAKAFEKVYNKNTQNKNWGIDAVYRLQEFGHSLPSHVADEYVDKISSNKDIMDGNKMPIIRKLSTSPEKFKDYLKGYPSVMFSINGREDLVNRSYHPMIAYDHIKDSVGAVQTPRMIKSLLNNKRMDGRLDDKHRVLSDLVDSNTKYNELNDSLFENMTNHRDVLQTLNSRKQDRAKENDHLLNAIFDENPNTKLPDDYINYKQKVNDLFVKQHLKYQTKFDSLSEERKDVGRQLNLDKPVEVGHFVNGLTAEENFKDYDKLYSPEEHKKIGNEFLQHGGVYRSMHMSQDDFENILPKEYLDISKEHHRGFIGGEDGKPRKDLTSFSHEDQKVLIKNPYFIGSSTYSSIKDLDKLSEDDLIKETGHINVRNLRNIAYHPEFKGDALLEKTRHSQLTGSNEDRKALSSIYSVMFHTKKHNEILKSPETVKEFVSMETNHEISPIPNKEFRDSIINHPDKATAATYINYLHQNKQINDSEFEDKIREHLKSGHNDLAYYASDRNFLPVSINHTILHYSTAPSPKNNDEKFLEDEDKHIIHQNLLGQGEDMFKKIMRHPNVDQKVKDYGQKYYTNEDGSYKDRRLG